jgi:N-methylhydantoinase A/oxoprolinase/acetone carboxylase beta subunit
MTQTYRLGIDIGGTFTDGVLLDERTGRVWTTKVLTTQQHEDAALAATAQLCSAASIGLDEVGVVAHATTLASNTVLLRRGGRVGLLTTRGFEDLLYLAREGRYDTYYLWLDSVEPLVERSACSGVSERILTDGTVYLPLSEAELDGIAENWRKDGIEAVAVCLLNSYVNKEHEVAAADYLRRRLGEGVPVSISGEVSPEMREYERACTTVLNAYLQPVMSQYQSRLEDGLLRGGYERTMYFMLSSGGLATRETASRFPVRMLESGPVAGVFAAAHVARSIEGLDAVALDVGGTTAKIALILNGQPSRSGSQEVCRSDRFAKGSGLPVQLPSIDLLEIGAGGGSIARVDALGFLQVGPQSAEARPGPACYNLGGIEPTVTDAALVLGYLAADRFAGGTVQLNVDAAVVALDRVGSVVGLTAEDCAATIIDALNEGMAQAVRVHLAERGQDASRLALIASGGGGPLHGPEVARRVGIPEVIVPRQPGVLSALGLVLTPPAIELAQSYVLQLDESTNWEGLNQLLDEMVDRARSLLAGTGVQMSEASVEWSADLRWIGQTHAFRVPLPGPPYGPRSRDEIVRLFDREAVRLHGLSLQETVLEALTWRVAIVGPSLAIPAEPADGSELTTSPVTHRGVYFPGEGIRQVPVYERARIAAGWEVAGPALVMDESSTCVIGASDSFSVDGRGDLHVLIDQQRSGSESQLHTAAAK